MPNTVNLREGLRSAIRAKKSSVIDDDQAFEFMLTQMVATLEMAHGGFGAGCAVAEKAIATTKIAGAASGSKAIKYTAFVVEESYLSVALLKLATNTNPLSITATLGATFLKKTALAFDLVGDDDKTAKILGAWTDLAGNVATAGLAFAEVTTPVGWAIAAGTVGLALVSAYKAYQASVETAR